MIDKPAVKPEYPGVIGEDPGKQLGVKEDPTVSPNGDEETPLTTDERIAKLEEANAKLTENYTNVRTAMQSERSRRQADAESHKRELQNLRETKAQEEALEGLEDDDAVPVAAFKKTAEVKRATLDERMLTRDLKIGGELSRAKHADFDEVVGPQMDEIEQRMSTDPAYTQTVLGGDGDPLNFVEHVYQTLKARKTEADEKVADADVTKVVDKVTNPVIGPKTMAVEKRPVPAKASTQEDMTDLETVRRLMRQGKITQEDLDNAWNK